jgi:hypothetical protein
VRDTALALTNAVISKSSAEDAAGCKNLNADIQPMLMTIKRKTPQ